MSPRVAVKSRSTHKASCSNQVEPAADRSPQTDDDRPGNDLNGGRVGRVHVACGGVGGDTDPGSVCRVVGEGNVVVWAAARRWSG